MEQKTGCCYTQTAIDNYIVGQIYQWQNRVPLKGAFKRLERHKAKVLRVVLRGLGGSNVPRLPGHQGKACHDLPPRVAFPELPTLPGLPAMVDPDSWLTSVNGEHFIRKVRSDGGVVLDKYDYYLGRELAGQYVALVIDAAKRQVVVEHHQQEVKRLNLKGLYGTRLSMQAYAEAIKLEARSERRGWRPKATEAASGGAAASTPALLPLTQMKQMPLPMAEETRV